jgi:hypothetical protein
VPVETLLRMLYLKHRYQLGYESVCREVADSLSWRRFCRIGLCESVPHPATLIKLVQRGGEGMAGQLNTALLDKLVQGKVLRCRKPESMSACHVIADSGSANCGIVPTKCKRREPTSAMVGPKNRPRKSLREYLRAR